MNTFVARGSIAGIYADGFDVITPEGHNAHGRVYSVVERKELLAAVERERAVIFHELARVRRAERWLRKLR